MRIKSSSVTFQVIPWFLFLFFFSLTGVLDHFLSSLLIQLMHSVRSVLFPLCDGSGAQENLRQLYLHRR